MKRVSLLLLLLAPLCAALHAEDQQFARIGDLKLENGEVIRDCVVGYRTFGTENPQKATWWYFPRISAGAQPTWLAALAQAKWWIAPSTT
jgi:homoserine O-acetyltransferase